MNFKLISLIFSGVTLAGGATAAAVIKNKNSPSQTESLNGSQEGSADGQTSNRLENGDSGATSSQNPSGAPSSSSVGVSDQSITQAREGNSESQVRGAENTQPVGVGG